MSALRDTLARGALAASLALGSSGAFGAPAAPAQADLPTVGTTVVADGWEITLHTYGPPAPTSASDASVHHVTTGFTIIDLESRPSACTEEIAIETAEGLRYTPVVLSQVSGPPRVVRGPGVALPEPATQQRYCVTDAQFEIAPAPTALTLYVLGIAFLLPR